MRFSIIPRARALSGVVMPLALAACASEYHPEYHPESSYTVNQSVSYPTIYQVAGASPPLIASSTPPPPSPQRPPTDSSRVLVVESAHLGRPGEIVAVIDVTNAKGTHDSGVALLRERAAELGADAVVSVEFHNGDGGRPARASGLAMRFQRSAHSSTQP